MKFTLLALASLTSLALLTNCSKDNIQSAESRPILDSVINGGGAKYPNKVFIDLSEGRQSGVNRASWDFGFSTGSEFRVTLNSSLNMLAKAVDKSDINAVTAADTVGFSALMVVGNAASPAALSLIDYPDGDLTKTAIAEVSATATENKVYIVNRGSDPEGVVRKWQKIRVLRNGSGYTLQYADISATTYSEIKVSKDADLNFTYVDLTKGAVTEVEPDKTKWDIAWTYFVNSTPLSATEYIPYGFQDFILLNRSGVSAVQVLNTLYTYETITLANATSLTFSTDVRAIGSSWRSGGGPTTSPAVRTDRFYVVKDAAGTYYKVQFISLTKAGERGYPQLKFEKIK